MGPASFRSAVKHHFLLAIYWPLSCSAADVVFDFSDALLEKRRSDHEHWGRPVLASAARGLPSPKSSSSTTECHRRVVPKLERAELRPGRRVRGTFRYAERTQRGGRRCAHREHTSHVATALHAASARSSASLRRTVFVAAVVRLSGWRNRALQRLRKSRIINKTLVYKPMHRAQESTLFSTFQTLS